MRANVKTVLIDGIEQLRRMACDARCGVVADADDVIRLADELVECMRGLTQEEKLTPVSIEWTPGDN
jgi:hypothetical protein